MLGKIQIISEFPLVIVGLTKFINDLYNSKIEIIGTCTLSNAINDYRIHAPQMIILDLMPDLSGLSLLKKFERENSPTILALASHPEAAIAYQAMMLGAAGFLSKRASQELFNQSIVALMKGCVYIEPEIANHLAIYNIKNKGNTSPFAELTGREMSICLLIMEGYKCTEIAEKINIAAKTTANYRTNIFKKLNVENDNQLLRLGIRSGVISI